MRAGVVLGIGLGGFADGIALHHVRDVPVHVPLYDWLFLGAAGLGFVAAGWLLARRETRGWRAPTR